MSVVFLSLICVLPMVCRAGNVAAKSPNGSKRTIQNQKTLTKTFSLSDGQTTVNLNVNINLIGKPGTPGKPPTGYPGQTTIIPTASPFTPGPTQFTTGGFGTPARSGSLGPNPEGPPASSPGTPFAQDGLNAHNYFRSFHDAPAMTLNSEMNTKTTEYAKKLAQMGTLQHSNKKEREGQGENLYMYCSTGGQEVTATQAVKAWYDEVCDPGYGFGAVQSPGGAGHFTQVVWIASTELGMGMAASPMGPMTCTYVVARYKPLGNYRQNPNSYNNNVKAGANFDKDNYCMNQKRRNDRKVGGFRLRDGTRIKVGVPEVVMKNRNVRPKILFGRVSKKEKINKKYRKHRF